MDRNRFVKLLVLITVIQVLCILLIPWRWFLAVLAVLASLCIYRLYVEVRHFLELSEQEKISQAANLAEENSEYLSKESPFPLYLFDDQYNITWLNEKAISLQEKYGAALWEKQLVPAIKAHSATGEVNLGKENLRYRIDFDKGIIFIENISQ